MVLVVEGVRYNCLRVKVIGRCVRDFHFPTPTSRLNHTGTAGYHQNSLMPFTCRSEDAKLFRTLLKKYQLFTEHNVERSCRNCLPILYLRTSSTRVVSYKLFTSVTATHSPENPLRCRAVEVLAVQSYSRLQRLRDVPGLRLLAALPSRYLCITHS